MAALQLAPEQRLELEALVASEDTDPLLRRRAQILLLADGRVGPGLNAEAISRELSVGRALVENTCRRLVEKGLDSALKRRPPQALAVPPLIADPTERTVTLSLMAADQPVELQLLIGDEPHRDFHLEAGEVRAVVVDGLSPGTVHDYRLEARAHDAEDVYCGRLTTRRRPGSSFRFAVLADVHLPIFALNQWLDKTGGPLAAMIRFGRARGKIAGILRRVLASIRDLDVDFVVSLGDLVHIAVDTPRSHLPPPDLRTAYRDLRSLLGPTTSQTALFTVLGNWDGENGWIAEPFRRAARTARLEALPTPKGRSYYSWTWGDALLIVLDATGFTTRAPKLEEGGEHAWTLGDAQLKWLEQTLASSSRRFKFLFMHHPVAGNGGDDINTAYARGGGRAAHRGEQTVVQELAERHGVQIIFHGHDHVFVDMTVNGVHYTLPGSAGAPWKLTADATGYESFDRRSGFATVEVAPDGVRVDFRGIDGERFDGYAIAPEP